MFFFNIPPPSIIFGYRFFCFTGHFLNIKRKFCEEEVIRRGGILKLNRLTNYLVIGEGLYNFMDKPLNNKMSTAAEMKKTGMPISIISEHHFIKNLKAPFGRIESIAIIESFTVPGKIYKVSVKDISCTCPNHIEDRNKFALNDPRRICKHLAFYLVKTGFVPDELKDHVEKIAVAAAYRGGIPGF